MPKLEYLKKKAASLPIPAVTEEQQREVAALMADLERAAELDARPAPRPRKIPGLWQAYLAWRELIDIRKRHVLRHAAILRGKSSLSAAFEADWKSDFGTVLDAYIAIHRQMMIDEATLHAGAIWQWLTAIRGLGEGSLAAQFLAQIDDIGRFDNISKLWRFAGYAVVAGEREYRESGHKATYNALLKSVVYLITDQFVRQNTEPYRAMYDAEKIKQRAAHPIAVCAECGEAAKMASKKIVGEDVDVWRCPANAKHRVRYTPLHIDLMARRKVSKIFLAQFWLVARGAAGLSVTAPYAMAILGHNGYEIMPIEERTVAHVTR